jgi:hypothetical protein
MEVTIVRFSRPLLINTAGCNSDFMQPVYGFLIPEPAYSLDPDKLHDYVGYLCGMHCYSNGDNYFTISYEERGVPDWVDKKGVVHLKQDAWLRKVQQKCIKKLNLSYSLVIVEMNEEDYDKYLNEENLIVDDDFYYDLERYQDTKGDPCTGKPFFEPLF